MAVPSKQKKAKGRIHSTLFWLLSESIHMLVTVVLVLVVTLALLRYFIKPSENN